MQESERSAGRPTEQIHSREKLILECNHNNLIDLMRVYYREMYKTPQFTKLIARVMQMPSGGFSDTLLLRCIIAR